jgi:hypothetical protein
MERPTYRKNRDPAYRIEIYRENEIYTENKGALIGEDKLGKKKLKIP